MSWGVRVATPALALALALSLALATLSSSACAPRTGGITLTVRTDDTIGLDAIEIVASVGETSFAAVRAPDPARALDAEETVGLVLDARELLDVDVELVVDGLRGDDALARGSVGVATKAGEVVAAEVALVALFACGDGEVDGDEQCDDSDDPDDAGADGDGCSAACEVEADWNCIDEPSVCQRCGDGVVQGAEECDDGAFAAGDGCAGACVVEPGWRCDNASPSACAPACGDGLVVDGVGALSEECDDGDGDEGGGVAGDGDGCSSACTREDGFDCDDAEPTACTSICGDGALVSDEVCDDGDGDDGDGCDSACELEDGFNCTPTTIAPTTCDEICGDGVQVGGEECDDGAALNSDSLPNACRTDCFAARCGDAVGDTGEPCDDGDLANDDACMTGCRLPACGDGFRTGAEACDDGNTADLDGCAVDCTFDVGSACFGAPSVCRSVGVVHVVDATGGGDFTTIAAAVAAAANGDALFVAAGTYVEALNINKALVIVGDGDVVIESAGEEPLEISGSGNVSVQGVTFSHTGTGKSAVKLGGSSTGSFAGCTFGPSDKHGVEASAGAAVTLLRSVVIANRDGGAKLDGGYTVESSVFIDNGSASPGGSPFGAAKLKNAGGVFRFNTVTNNLVDDDKPVIQCEAAIAIESSIVFGNSDAGPTLAASCDGATSATSPDIDPVFAADGFHLDFASPFKEAAASCPAADVDGEAQMGAACALGADERP